MSLLPRLCLALATLLPTLHATTASAADVTEARVIVKLRTGSPLKQIQAAGRVEMLGQRLGLATRLAGQPAQDLHVVRASGLSSEALARRLSRDADVEYAVPDRLKKALALPNDPLFGFQWYLQASSVTQPAATNAQAAWGLTSGSASVVVAVVDTGVRLDHEDLAPRLLPGYDFISDDLLSGDGQNGRDADPSDPGDYLSSADLANSELRTLCNTTLPTTSSWHGTQVAGILAAETNNSSGIAGMAGGSRLLPVRVLGKCGGFDSDIIAGMRWAAGLSVPGVPANPNPARVINVSLGGEGNCSPAFAAAIAEIQTAGALVVAAAGNETGPVLEPANCAGVLAVAGIRHVGTKVGYSSYGAEVGISAPAGNCVNVLAGQPCLFPLINTINLGSTVPAGNGYTGINDVTVGTSFATPLVAGTAALMLAANPALGSPEIIRLIKTSAVPFPTDASLPNCPLVTSDGQCNCTTTTCGAGMLNTGTAVAAALATVATAPVARITVSATPTAQTAFTLDASGSTSADGSRIVAWKWVQVSGPQAGSFSADNVAAPSFTAPAAGTYVLSVTVTTAAGRQGSSQTSIDVQAAPAKSSSGGGGGAMDMASLALLGLLAPLAFLLRRRGLASRD